MYCITGRGKHSQSAPTLRPSVKAFLENETVKQQYNCASRVFAGHVIVQCFEVGAQAEPPSDELCRQVERQVNGGVAIGDGERRQARSKARRDDAHPEATNEWQSQEQQLFGSYEAHGGHGGSEAQGSYDYGYGYGYAMPTYPAGTLLVQRLYIACCVSRPPRACLHV